VSPDEHKLCFKAGDNYCLNSFVSGFTRLSPANKKDLSTKINVPETPDTPNTFPRNWWRKAMIKPIES